MKEKISRKEAEQKIKEFFEQMRFDSEGAKKIKKLAMKFNLKLGLYRKRFCKKCFSDLKNAKIRVDKDYKNIKCIECRFVNRYKIKTF